MSTSGLWDVSWPIAAMAGELSAKSDLTPILRLAHFLSRFVLALLVEKLSAMKVYIRVVES